MQTFRAYTQDAAGTITWAAWIEAAHSDEARRLADALCPGGSPALDLWTVAARDFAGARLEPV
jgi:hypothetical protein